MSNIKSIKKHKIENQKLYNLAVEKDESFVCQGIVVHNCRSLMIPIFITETDDTDSYYNDYQNKFEAWGTGVKPENRLPAKGFGG